MTATFEDTEVWTTPAGRRVCLVARRRTVPAAEGEWDDHDGWYADFPGQRPPVHYELLDVVSAEVVEERTVFPLEPWSPYDAISDVLVREGYTPPPQPDPGTCEHGLSADLCAGPMHYPDDRFDW